MLIMQIVQDQITMQVTQEQTIMQATHQQAIIQTILQRIHKTHKEAIISHQIMKKENLKNMKLPQHVKLLVEQKQ